MLSTCPSEIADLILDELCHHHKKDVKDYYPYWYDDKQDETSAPIEVEAKPNLTALAHLRQSCKRLHNLTTWRLFHTLTALATSEKWWLIARTLIERPELAELVKSLSFGNKMVPPASIPDAVKTYYETQVAAIIPYNNDEERESEVYDYHEITELGYAAQPEEVIGVCDLAYEKLSDHEEECHAPVAILLSLCPNLEALELVAKDSAKPFSFCRPGSLPGVHSFYARWPGFQHGFDIVTLRRLFLATSNLRLLHLRGPWGCHRLADTAKPVVLKNVEAVQVASGSLDQRSLVALLRVCPNMQSLRYSAETSVNPEPFYVLEAGDAVAKYSCPNLKHFELDVTNWDGFEGFSEDDLLVVKSKLEKKGIKCEFVEIFSGEEENRGPRFYK